MMEVMVKFGTLDNNIANDVQDGSPPSMIHQSHAATAIIEQRVTCRQPAFPSGRMEKTRSAAL